MASEILGKYGHMATWNHPWKNMDQTKHLATIPNSNGLYDHILVFQIVIWRVQSHFQTNHFFPMFIYIYSATKSPCLSSENRHI